MMSVPAARLKNLRLPLRTEPTALDDERHFLIRVLRHDAKQPVTHKVDTAGQSLRRNYT